MESPEISKIARQKLPPWTSLLESQNRFNTGLKLDILSSIELSEKEKSYMSEELVKE